MEIYRTFIGPFPDCRSYDALREIYRTALPAIQPVDPAECTLDTLKKRDDKMFFPQETLKNLLNAARIRLILDCKCVKCEPHRESNLSQFEELVDWVSRRAPILLAILIYIGHPWMIKSLTKSSCTDQNLGDVTAGHRHLNGASEIFKDAYRKAYDLFRPAVFIMGAPAFAYEDYERFPYMRDEFHAKGSFGEVWKFEIHPDYIDESLRVKYPQLKQSVNGTSSKPLMFARKILKKHLHDEDLKMERQVLYVIAKQEHPNIVDLIAFYSWRGNVHFVFPFVELNLDHVLHRDWKPENIVHAGRFPDHWLWQQMIRVADALKTIHNPPNQLWPERGNIIGFHFDLKPANILVTAQGVLQITDFGQSMVKLVQESEPGYGVYIGGDFGYQPPEVCPTRTELRSVLPDVTESPAPPQPAKFGRALSSEGSIHSTLPMLDSSNPRASLSASSRRGSSLSQGTLFTAMQRELEKYEESQQTSPRTSSIAVSEYPNSPTVPATSTYDVWSLACIMLEVLTYIFKDGPIGVENFEKNRIIKGGRAFHDRNGNLKGCVKSEIGSLRNLDVANDVSSSYLNGTLNILCRMLSIDPTQRPVSEQVVSQFNQLTLEHQEFDDPDQDMIRYLRDYRKIERFREVGYLEDGVVKPFYQMKHIKYETGSRENRSLVECKIQIFCKSNMAIQIKLCYRDTSDHLRPESFTFVRKASYCPLYLYDKDRPTACAVFDTHDQVILHFPSEDDLMVFQSIITRFEPVRGVRISKVKLKPLRESSEEYDGLHRPDALPWCQIWTGYEPHYHAVYDGKKAIYEEPIARQGDPPTITIRRSDRWNRYFVIMRPQDVSPMTSFEAPAMPLSQWMEDQDDDPMYRRASRVDITFIGPAHLDRLYRVIQDANNANEFQSNKITWSPWRSHRI
ncbi:MAG: hypothetical protein M1818_002236 [Claussenomyces sp. TS43310]|nr:MAG: hypothetical protein M1818_002236 [Claussenomyces sp. TS43310]